jgi:hypothetical protein
LPLIGGLGGLYQQVWKDGKFGELSIYFCRKRIENVVILSSLNKNLTNDSIYILRGHKQRKSKVHRIGLELALENASSEGRFNPALSGI